MFHEKNVPMQIYLPKELKERFDSLCKEKSINKSDLLRKYIEDFTKEGENND